jgi:hypothetical protein
LTPEKEKQLQALQEQLKAAEANVDEQIAHLDKLDPAKFPSPLTEDKATELRALLKSNPMAGKLSPWVEGNLKPFKVADLVGTENAEAFPVLMDAEGNLTDKNNVPLRMMDTHPSIAHLSVLGRKLKEGEKIEQPIQELLGELSGETLKDDFSNLVIPKEAIKTDLNQKSTEKQAKYEQALKLMQFAMADIKSQLNNKSLPPEKRKELTARLETLKKAYEKAWQPQRDVFNGQIQEATKKLQALSPSDPEFDNKRAAIAKELGKTMAWIIKLGNRENKLRALTYLSINNAPPPGDYMRATLGFFNLNLLDPEDVECFKQVAALYKSWNTPKLTENRQKQVEADIKALQDLINIDSEKKPTITAKKD